MNPTTSAVSGAIEFRSWHRDNARSFDANRLLFPALGHFDQVAAFICTELLRAGADTSLTRAFALTEPIIELAIERLGLKDRAILGLAGRAPPARRSISQSSGPAGCPNHRIVGRVEEVLTGLLLGLYSGSR